MNRRTDLVRWCVVALSYRVDSVQETATRENRTVSDFGTLSVSMQAAGITKFLTVKRRLKKKKKQDINNICLHK